MARVYATVDDLAEWSGAPAPANAAGLLRFASALVAAATANTYYPTDADGYPTALGDVEAFRDATTAQAAYWNANGLDPAKGALGELGKGHATSKAIKGASVGYSVTLVEANNAARRAAVESLGTEAWLILNNAGLVSAAIR